MALFSRLSGRFGRRIYNSSLLQTNSNIFCLPSASVSYQYDGRGGYSKTIEKPRKEMIKEGMQHLKGEFGVLKDEIEAKLSLDALVPIKHDDYEIPWNFRGTDTYKTWIATADSDHNEGFSKAELIRSKNSNALFRGHLATKIPKDGVIVRSGYCNVRSPRNKKSFHRFIPYDWSLFTHLVICCRGDGRTYALNLIQDTYFDLTQYDQYNYFLYTHGGPYWQTTKIPFSKFFLSSKGRIQDKQAPIDLDNIRSMGITMADDIEGPFQLEIAYIGLTVDFNHHGDFDYEMYEADREIVGT